MKTQITLGDFMQLKSDIFSFLDCYDRYQRAVSSARQSAIAQGEEPSKVDWIVTVSMLQKLIGAARLGNIDSFYDEKCSRFSEHEKLFHVIALATAPFEADLSGTLVLYEKKFLSFSEYVWFGIVEILSMIHLDYTEFYDKTEFEPTLRFVNSIERDIKMLKDAVIRETITAQSFYIRYRNDIDQALEEHFSEEKSILDRIQSENERLIIESLYDCECFDESSKLSQQKILNVFDGDVNSYKRYWPILQEKRLISKGADGRGFFLLPAVIEFLNGVKNFDTGAPPTN